MEYKEAFNRVAEELEKDKDLFYSWQSNIACAFMDVCHREGYQFPALHKLSNEAAVHFLRRIKKD